MKLYNVRKGQFVYYDNKLHKVYSVKPFFKQSVHLVRLNDLEQQLTTAKEIELYKPKHLDSFICNHKRYTLHKNSQAKIGDYILVINPRPDSLDHHHLHAIELVSSIEKNGVISNKSNGIKHNEYWVMVPGLLEGANKIDFQHPRTDKNSNEHEAIPLSPEVDLPKMGDVFQKNDSAPIIQAMVIAIKGRTIYLGGNLVVEKSEIVDPEKWSFVHNIFDQ
ncbi:hypothetical protein ACFSKI_01500 [Pseudogracilibacillus auburnensis]|uniref:Uncharacterized protein n=1 Tax=Pseudogracilibacillus auburnensis TaxID=1494959 RepID=A0A2V3VWK9_9BACI|nr:hypothetical protein [Pseudogracilibacillus auburnensis]MBO1002455.1 hypothetical protein [Pseudogracilibacillus auburnensis]PXW80919.1 hypothetical protein DFR56_12427 [Pseudogracilibacillus auburnensis]